MCMMTQIKKGQRQIDQRQQEDHWTARWAEPMRLYLNAQSVREKRPSEDPPDVEFHVVLGDGSETKTWGEVTGTYYSSEDASWLWDRKPDPRGRTYVEPDATMAENAVACVRRKIEKYDSLVKERGLGHLLVLLLNPLTTRSTRVKVEESILRMLHERVSADLGPFKSIWLGYHLPETSPDEQEKRQYAFLDEKNGRQFNFMKCIAQYDRVEKKIIAHRCHSNKLYDYDGDCAV